MKKVSVKKVLAYLFLAIVLFMFISTGIFLLVNYNFNPNTSLNHHENLFIIKSKKDTNYFPLVVAHRGGARLGPENTLVAFSNSSKLGVDVLEMDLRLTKDNKLVVHHDKTIDRTSDGRGNVSDLTLPELKKFNFGYQFHQTKGTFPIVTTNRSSQILWFKEKTNYPYRYQKVEIPTFEQVLHQFSNTFMIEIKDRGARGEMAVDQVFELISQSNIHRHLSQVIFGSFDSHVLDYIYQKYNLENTSNGRPVIGAGPVESVKFLFSALTKLNLFQFKASILLLPPEIAKFNLTSSDYINLAHQRNLAIHYWTINDPVQMKNLIVKKVDGILTDRPDVLVNLKPN